MRGSESQLIGGHKGHGPKRSSTSLCNLLDEGLHRQHHVLNQDEEAELGWEVEVTNRVPACALGGSYL